MKIGIVAGSFKPYHLGHDEIIRLASRECDEVHLYVSTSDRVRKGELPILGADMAMLWKATIEGSLPANVKVTYGGSPIANVWKELGAANDAATGDDYVIYSDPVDVTDNFPVRNLEKYCGELYSSGYVRLRPVDRASTVEISGTKMREMLASGDKAGFVKHLPEGIDSDLVWDTLQKSIRSLPQKPAKKATKTEGLLRRNHCLCSFCRKLLRK